MIIIDTDAKAQQAGHAPGGKPFVEDKNVRTGEILCDFYRDSTGAVQVKFHEISMDDLLRTNSDTGHQYVRVLAKTKITFKITLGGLWQFDKAAKIFDLVKAEHAKFYAIEYDDTAIEMKEFVLYATPSGKQQQNDNVGEVHPFNLKIKARNGMEGTVAALGAVHGTTVDPDIKNPPPIGG